MVKCVDNTDQTTLNRLATATGPTVDAKGAYTFNQIDVFADELAANILAEADNNPISVAVNRYGNSFYDAVTYVNNDFKNRVLNNLQDYPELKARWDRGNITNLEAADFLRVANYTPSDLQTQRDFVKLTRQLNNYYKDSFSKSIMGGFCATMENIFQQIDAFYDLIGVVDGIITDALEFINKVRNFDGFDITKEQVEKEIKEKLIDEIKKKIEDVIDQIIQEVVDAINNFNIESLISDFVVGGVAGAKAILTTKEQLCAFFTDENKKTIKDKVRGLIDYAISMFESPDLAQIQFLVYRFCALATNIEALLKDIKRPLDDYTQRHQRIVNRLKTISNMNTSTAIRNGGIRLSEERRRESINRLRDNWKGVSGERITPTGEEPIIVEPITIAEYGSLPTCGKVWKGEVNWLKIEKTEGGWTDEKEGVGIYGYTRIDLDVKVYLKRIYDELGGTYTIVEGWYSKDWNDKQEFDPENSHLSGYVIDIKKDMADVEAFTDAAFKAGFKGVAVYSDVIHLDIREIGPVLSYSVEVDEIVTEE